MAIVRSAGTEIIRSASFNDVDNTNQVLIQGVQHHIYTVLSIIIHTTAQSATTNWLTVKLTGYDSKGGTTNTGMEVFRYDLETHGTFVWNAKFSFNGYEPVNFTGPLDDATKQDAIADQGSGVAQVLSCYSDNASDSSRVHITYIDQNNA